MKQFYLLLIACAFSTMSLAQINFSEDFESYEVDKYLGPQSTKWSTWSGTEGNAEDVKITSKAASSGTKSIYFSSTAATGGPQDVILKFDDLFTKNLFEFSLKMNVEEGKTGYFNFQGDKVVGTTWAIDINFTADKVVNITSGGVIVATSAYEQGKWEKISFKGNISSNKWSASINDKEIGQFKLVTNRVASIDIYPANASASYYVDDITYSTAPYTPPPFDASVIGGLVPTKDLTGRDIPVQIIVANEGGKEINNLEVSYTVGGKTSTKTVSNLKLASFKNTTITFDELHTVKKNLNDFKFGLKLLDGADDNDANNSAKAVLIGVTPAADKFIIAEEATGTWCGWCPRGAVALERMQKRFPDHFVGIAVHNGDPMAVTEYDNGVKSLPGFSGFPGASVGRQEVIDPAAIETDFWARIVEEADAKVRVGATFDDATRVLKLSPEITFNADVTGTYKLAVAIVEDSVRGTAAGYNQTNYYANNAAGPMGGYELLPSPVPASKMVYNHVGRAILGGFKGQDVPAGPYKKGDKVVMSFQYTLPAALKNKNIEIVPILLDENGLIENGYKASISEAVAYGIVGVKDQVNTIKEVSIYPMPVSFISIIELNLATTQEVSVEIFDISGKLIGSKNYGSLQGEQNLELNGSMLQNGSYIARINVGKENITKSIVVQH
jgi:thiol-disulfide isomerase/thioredoxin